MDSVAHRDCGRRGTAGVSPRGVLCARVLSLLALFSCHRLYVSILTMQRKLTAQVIEQEGDFNALRRYDIFGNMLVVVPCVYSKHEAGANRQLA